MLVPRALRLAVATNLLLAAFVWAQEKPNDAIVPAPREGTWMKRHDSFNERVKQGNADLIFIGDSITQGWENAGKTVWAEFYAKRNAVNLGIGGDRTQHVLWRLDHGNIEGIHPKLAVVMIGTNNSGSNTSAQIAEGVKLIVEKLRAKLPTTKVLVLAIFPRADNFDAAKNKPEKGTKDDAKRKVNEGANEIIKGLADSKMVYYLDIGPKFLEADGTLSREVMPDLLHLNEKSYRTWAEAIEPKVKELLGEKSAHRAMPLTHKSAPVTADSPLVGARIDRLVQQLCGLSRSQVIGLFDHGCVWRNGAVITQPAERMVAGDKVELRYDANQRYHPKPKPRRNLGFDIVFEDKHLIVVNKPAELLTVPTRREETNTLQHKVEAYVRHVSKGRGAFPVHRLDRGVSGLLVFGKTQTIVRQLKDQFAAHKPEREYLAIVAGRVQQDEGTFETFLATDKDLNRFSTEDETIGQLAITHFRVIARLEGGTLVQVRLETGRRNQIRVHFAEAGHPVLGDPRYQPKLAAHPRWPHQRLALHARLLGFEHPINGQALRFESQLPSEIAQFLEHLGKSPRRAKR